MRIEMGGAAWSAAGLPDVAGRTVYRVVQEGLTNARKHAPGQPVTVTLGGGQGAGLDVSLVNPAGPASAGPASVGPASAGPASAVPGSGAGLIGLTERVELAGGRLDWASSDGEFLLRAWLPWPETEHNVTCACD
jgi:signal transduction histidine kinase